MGKHIKEIMSEVRQLNESIQQVISYSDYDNYEDLSGLEWDKSSADDLFLLDNLKHILSKLDEVSQIVKYLDRPINIEGILHKNENGRYEVQDVELSSGYSLEYLSLDDAHCRYNEKNEYVPTPYWVASRIEHNGQDYCIVGATEFNTLENVCVRIRK